MKLNQVRKRGWIFLLGLVLAGGGVLVVRPKPTCIPTQRSVQFLIGGERDAATARFVVRTVGSHLVLVAA